MFKDMRDTGQTSRLVAGSDLVPHLRDRNGGTVVFLDEDFHTIIEHEFVDLGCRSASCCKQQESKPQSFSNHAVSFSLVTHVTDVIVLAFRWRNTAPSIINDTAKRILFPFR
jgi:hypothetical protein